MKRETQFGAIACLLLAAMSWGGGLAVGKVAMMVVDAYHLTAIRYGVAALVFVAFLVYAEGPGALAFDGKTGAVLVLGIVGIGGGVLLLFVGLHRTRAEHAAVIVATQPLMAALLTWVFRNRTPARRTMLAIALALAGVTLVVTRGDPRSLLGGGTAVGDLMVLSGALCWVTYTLSAGAFPNWSPLRYTTLTATTGVFFVLAATLGAVMLGAAAIPAPAQLISVGWEILFVTLGSALLGTLSWNIGIRKVGADGVLFINFVPITAFAIGIFQGYQFNWAEVLGAVFVISALLVNRFAATPDVAPVTERAANGNATPISGSS